LKKVLLAAGRAEEITPAAAIEELKKLAAAPDVMACWQNLRWIELQLSSPELLQAERAAELCDGWLKFLRSEKGAEHLRGLPEGFRERYLQRLGNLKPAAKTSTGPPVGPPPPESKK
jgi:hypothetical protein